MTLREIAIKSLVPILIGAGLFAFLPPAMAPVQEAEAAISIPLAINPDDTYDTNYPNGDKPTVGCSAPATWTEADVGDGGGEVCDTTGEWVFSVFGTTFRQNAHLIYKDAGAADVQFEGTVLDDYTGATGNNAGLGIGLREAATQASYIFQIHSTNTGSPQVECTYGANGTYTTIDGPLGEIRSTDLVVSYDISTGDLKAGAGGVEVCSTNRAMSDVLAYAVGQSKSITETLTATLQAPTLSSTIDWYTPPSGGAPTQTGTIPAQTGVQGTALTALDISGYFTGETSYSISGLPGSTGLSFNTATGVLTGTPNANDAPGFTASMCGVNGSGSTCQNVGFTISPTPGSGNTFTVPDVANVLSTFNCASASGANGATWASIRSGSPSHTTPQPGDIIEITSDSRGGTHFSNCHGDETGYITIRKTASATRLTITGAGGSNDAFLCENCTYVHINGLVNWTGNTAGCGNSNLDMDETPLDDCGILVNATNQFAVKLRGKAQNIIVEGIEADGDWPRNVSVTGGDVAFSPNDQDYCVDDTPSLLNREFREGLVFRNNYLHDFAKEIVYFGPNVEYGNCTVDTTPRLKDITISGNFIQYAGWDGLNLKSAFTGTNIIEHNVVLDIGGGTTASGANSVGISLFESEGTVRYNKVRRTTDPPGGAAGINCSANKAPSSWGTLDCQIYGNEVADTDGDCTNLGRGTNADANRSGAVYNNTLVDCGGSPVDIGGSVTGGVTVRDNISNKAFLAGGGTVTVTNNRNCAEGSCGFVDDDSDGNVNDNDYRLTAGSGAVNNGTANCPSTDMLGVSRPQGAACDQGAYEFDE